MDYKSPLSKARGLGAAKEGSAHWMMQRITAIALVFLSITLVFSFVNDYNSFAHFIRAAKSPIYASVFVLFFVVALYHGYLGMRVIYEDYISCHCGRNFMLLLTGFVAAFTAILLVVSVLYVHVNNGRTIGQAGYWHKKQMHCAKYTKKACMKDGKMNGICEKRYKRKCLMDK